MYRFWPETLAILLSLAVKILWVLKVPAYPTMDAFRYLENAQLISIGKIPDPYWPIGYSAFLVPLLPLNSLLLIKVINVFLSTGIAINAWLLGRWIAPQRKISNGIVLVLVAFFPDLIFYCSLLWSEILFIFLATLAVNAQVRANSLSKLTVAGVLYAIACFVRPVALFLPLCVSVVVWLCRARKYPKLVRGTGTILVVLVVLHLPWTIFWKLKSGTALFVSANGDTNLFIGNNPWATGYYDETGLIKLDESGYSGRKAPLVFEYWKEYPLRLPSLIGKKLVFALFGTNGPYEGAGGSHGLKIIADSQIRATVTQEQYNDLSSRAKQYFQQDSEVSYSLKEGLGLMEQAIVAHELLYSGHGGHVEMIQLFRKAESVAGAYYLILILAAFLSLLVRPDGRTHGVYLIPLYFLVIVAAFFGSPRFFLPSVPFIAIGVANWFVRLRARWSID